MFETGLISGLKHKSVNLDHTKIIKEVSIKVQGCLIRGIRMMDRNGDKVVDISLGRNFT